MTSLRGSFSSTYESLQIGPCSQFSWIVLTIGQLLVVVCFVFCQAVVFRVFTIELYAQNGVVRSGQSQSYQ